MDGENMIQAPPHSDALWLAFVATDSVDTDI